MENSLGTLLFVSSSMQPVGTGTTMCTANDCRRRGAALLKRGEAAEAALAFRQLLRIDPISAAAHMSLAVALRLEHRLEEAIVHCREAVRLAPEMAEAHGNLGSMLSDVGRYEEAIVSLRQAVYLAPDLANAWSNLGIALYRQRRYEEAMAHYRRAIAIQPDLAEAHNNLASTLADRGNGEEALASFEEAIRLRPDYREPHWGRALVWLSQGKFERGWPEFEWRPLPEIKGWHQPRWDGSDLQGRKILLVGEQGLGDTLQFVRYGALVKRRGGKVVLACQPRLVRLLAEGCSVVDEVVSQDQDLPSFDVYSPLLSLPTIFGTSLASVPTDIPYLEPSVPLAERWRRDLAPLPGIKIGIAWQGSTRYDGDCERSIPLAAFEPLARLPNVQLVSLQKGPGREQLTEIKQRFPVLDFGNRLDEPSGPFIDTAAIMRSLDLVVTCDSALCHLAGAMGVRVWVALPAAADWRWLAGRDDSPWYPTMRLFRQTCAGEWGDVFRNMACRLGTEDCRAR